MKLVTIKLQGQEILSLVTAGGVVPLVDIDKKYKGDLVDLMRSGQFDDLLKGNYLLDEIELKGKEIDLDIVSYAPLYRKSEKIIGIGLNYQEHASDLDVAPPKTYPVIFLKPDSTIVGYEDQIIIPKISQKTTGEAELGIIIKKECRDIKPEEWLDYVAGFTTILDMTAEDVLRQNTRYLELSKVFDTFFSFGPQLLTADEIDDISKLRVSTVVNGEIKGSNVVANMTFSPSFLVSFLSNVFTLNPGDIISTGTPRAAKITQDDTIECRIDGFETLVNNVIDLKNA